MKRCSISYVIREFQIISTMRHHCHQTLIEMIKIQTLITSNAEEDVEPQEVSLIAGENSKCTTSLEDSLTVSYKAKHHFTIRLSNYIPTIAFLSTQMSQKLMLCKNQQKNAYSSFIHN